MYFNRSCYYGKMNVQQLRCKNEALFIPVAKKEIHDKFVGVLYSRFYNSLPAGSKNKKNFFSNF